MFVDDLILKPFTLEELKIQIDIVTKHGNDTGCIINLDEKIGITVSSSSRSGNITKLCTEHPLPL
jgi:DNA-binding response OmpR family regulator